MNNENINNSNKNINSTKNSINEKVNFDVSGKSDKIIHFDKNKNIDVLKQNWNVKYPDETFVNIHIHKHFFREIKNGDLELAKLFLKAGADVNIATKYGLTPLYIASQTGDLEIVEVLITSGADVNKTHNPRGWTALHMASQNGHLETVKVLIASGGLVNEADKDGTTPLYIASRFGHLEIVVRNYKNDNLMQQIQMDKVQ